MIYNMPKKHLDSFYIIVVWKMRPLFYYLFRFSLFLLTGYRPVYEETLQRKKGDIWNTFCKKTNFKNALNINIFQVLVVSTWRRGNFCQYNRQENTHNNKICEQCWLCAFLRNLNQNFSFSINIKDQSML